MEPSTRVLRGLRYENTPDVRYITTHHESHYFEIAESREELVASLPDYTLPDESLDIELVSETKKILFKVDDSFFHFFMDSLPVILKIHREHPEVLLVLYLQTARQTKLNDQLMELLQLILDGEGANYTFVKIAEGFDHSPILKVSNFSKADPYFSGNNFTSFVDVLNAVDTVIKYTNQVLGTRTSPTVGKKIYLSSPPRYNWYLDVDGDPNYSGYLDDLRMYETEKLEDFFRELGYEIVDPTKDFDSLYEQIDYMMNVDVLVAVTCSGLANMIFMDPKKLVVEIQAEIVQNLPAPEEARGSRPMQGVHTMYSMLTFMKDHTLVSIPSHRNPDDVIKTIKTTKLLQLIG